MVSLGHNELMVNAANSTKWWSPVTVIFPHWKQTEIRLDVRSEAALGLRPANERRRYIITTSLIGWAQTWNQPCKVCHTIVASEVVVMTTYGAASGDEFGIMANLCLRCYSNPMHTYLVLTNVYHVADDIFKLIFLNVVYLDWNVPEFWSQGSIRRCHHRFS